MVRSRIAPTPSGYLHIGNAINFVLTYLWVRKQKGTLLLRIDDLDTTRSRPEYIQDIFKTLNWLGLTWDHGPQTPDEHQKQFTQHTHTQRYQNLINKLINTGKVFASTTSRSQVAGGNTGADMGLNLPLNTPDTALRIVTPDPCIIYVHDINTGSHCVNLHETMPHFTIRRRDGITAYQIASLADDIDYCTNLILRGNDLLSSTAAQLYLEQLTGGNTFAQCRFYHHPLLTNQQGIKLSKSAGSVLLKALRQTDHQPKYVFQFLSNLLGWKRPANSVNDMLQRVLQGETLIMPAGNLMV